MVTPWWVGGDFHVTVSPLTVNRCYDTSYRWPLEPFPKEPQSARRPGLFLTLNTCRSDDVNRSFATLLGNSASTGAGRFAKKRWMRCGEKIPQWTVSFFSCAGTEFLTAPALPRLVVII